MSHKGKMLFAIGLGGWLMSASGAPLQAQEPNPTSQTTTQNNEITKQENGIYLYRVESDPARPGCGELSSPQRLDEDCL